MRSRLAAYGADDGYGCIQMGRDMLSFPCAHPQLCTQMSLDCRFPESPCNIQMSTTEPTASAPAAAASAPNVNVRANLVSLLLSTNSGTSAGHLLQPISPSIVVVNGLA